MQTIIYLDMGQKVTLKPRCTGQNVPERTISPIFGQQNSVISKNWQNYKLFTVHIPSYSEKVLPA